MFNWLWDGARIEAGLIPVVAPSLPEFPFTPLQDGYQVAERDEVVFMPLEGGLPYSRADMEGGTNDVPVKFRLSGADYDEFVDFFRNEISYGQDPFDLYLCVNDGVPTLTECKIVPGTIRISDFVYGTTTLEFRVEAFTDETDLAADQIIIDGFTG